MIGGDITELGAGPITECTRIGHTVCSTKRDIDKMKRFLQCAGIKNTPSTSNEIIENMKDLLNVNKESEIYVSNAYQRFVGSEEANRSLFANFLPKGPANSTALLNDTNIDGALARWAYISKEEFGKNFYHIPFQMIDFLEHNTELARIDLLELQEQGYDCFGVVLNTDVSSGRGIHWFCLYGVIKKGEPITIEYFNSSGYPPKPSVTYWMEATSMKLQKKSIPCEIINATRGRQVQFSRTECGVWSLVYILSRLKDYSPSWITKASDHDITEFRKRLFRL
jgi:hypothetical protein